MISKVNKGLTTNQTPADVDSITLQTDTGDILLKKQQNAEAPGEPQTRSPKAFALAADAKGAKNMEANLRRFSIEQDLDQPDMAVQQHQHNQTDLEFLKSKRARKSSS